jgi:hypothetical protein
LQTLPIHAATARITLCPSRPTIRSRSTPTSDTGAGIALHADPYAGIVFASVVALVPGVYVFRTLSGFAQFGSDPSPALLSATASDLSVASIRVVGMAVGLALPMHFFTNALSWR